MRGWCGGVVAFARRNELPTWGLILLIYGGWMALTLNWHRLPLPILLASAAWLSAWHMSLQHELIHGHPTRSGRVNAALGAPPLNLWLPFALYRDEHRLHHRNPSLTDPLDDPESTYVPPERWVGLPPALRWLHVTCNTLPGRILLGPPYAVTALWVRQAHRVGRHAPWRLWLGHAAGVGLVLAWVCGVCHVGFAVYLACFVYPGTALTMVRSLAEHRAAECPADRTAVVERAGLFGLLFLNNNLHVLHHEHPSIPWYDLPVQWRARREAMLAARRGPIYRGYAEVARRYAFAPHHAGPHPFASHRPELAGSAEALAESAPG